MIRESARRANPRVTITGLGLGCVMNLPIVFAGSVLGTVNLLDREGAYNERHVEPAMTIARQILPVLVMKNA
jgi:hypothetical protein